MSQFFVIGKCIGLKSKDKVVDGKPTKDWHVGIAVAKENGFEGETEVVAIKVKPEFQDAGLLQVYANLKGKDLMVPVRPFAYGTRGDSAANSWSLAGDGQPRAVPNLQPLTLKPSAAAPAQ